MTVLTGEEVVSAIASAVHSGFTRVEIKNVYKNKPVQGMVKPCAFIHAVSSSFSNEMRGRGEQNDIIDIRVHPEDTRNDVETWARKIANKLRDIINTITIDGRPVKTRTLTWRTEDGVLHMVATYSFKVIHVQPSDPRMENLYYGERVKK